MAKNKFILYFLLAGMSGIFLWLAWPPRHSTYIVFFAFVPLLLMEKLITEEKKHNSALKIFLFTYLSFVLWNYLTTWWIHYATMAGTIMTVILNSLIMFFPFLLYHKVRLKGGKLLGYIALPSFWLVYEYLHLNWDLSWPWLTLGNVFALQISWIQWYEYTGILGGTLWIWIINLIIFSIFENLIDQDSRSRWKRNVIVGLSATALFLLLPYFISKQVIIREGIPAGMNVVVVQPNIDPYKEKFDENTLNSQITKLITLSENAIDRNTVLLVWPETAISVSLDERTLNDNQIIIRIRNFLKKHPRMKLITGLDSYKFYMKDEKPSPTARIMMPDSFYYDYHNSALLLDTSANFRIYYKSRLVPGVEKMPYPKFFRFLEKYTINLGGTSGTLGKQDKPSVFRINDKIVVAPAICYESIYGDYLGDFVMIGANLIVVITNDGWWGETDGYKQHFSYAAMRAIELRKDVVRSANTGISGYINSRGEVVERTKFWEPAVFKKELYINDTITFYARFGDYLGWFAAILGGTILFLYLTLLVLVKKK